MKKTLIGVLFAVLILSCVACVSYAASNIRIFVDGKEIYTDVPPMIVSGRTMVPLRVVADALNAGVNWDSNTQAVNISFGKDEEAEYNAFIAEGKNKLDPLKSKYTSAANELTDPQMYALLQQLSKTHDYLINKAMSIHPPKDKATEFNQVFKKLVTNKVCLDLAARSIEEKEKGNREVGTALMFEAFRNMEI